MANLVLFVWVFCLGPGPVPCFASLLFLFGETKSGRGICVSGFSCLWFCFCLMIGPFLMKPRRFMLNFLISLLAYRNVRTEPQRDIGHNRGKKNKSFCPSYFQWYYCVFSEFSMSFHVGSPRFRPSLPHWSGNIKQMRCLCMIGYNQLPKLM